MMMGGGFSTGRSSTVHRPRVQRQGAEKERREQVLRHMLETTEVEVLEKMRLLRTTLPASSEPVKDPEEAGVEDVARDMEVALAEIGSATLRAIHEALQRLDEGGYGLCADCGEPIPEARLSVLPFASLCRDCQQREEEAAPPTEHAWRGAVEELEKPPRVAGIR